MWHTAERRNPLEGRPYSEEEKECVCSEQEAVGKIRGQAEGFDVRDSGGDWPYIWFVEDGFCGQERMDSTKVELEQGLTGFCLWKNMASRCLRMRLQQLYSSSASCCLGALHLARLGRALGDQAGTSQPSARTWHAMYSQVLRCAALTLQGRVTLRCLSAVMGFATGTG
jgi:hypothetical protein